MVSTELVLLTTFVILASVQIFSSFPMTTYKRLQKFKR